MDQNTFQVWDFILANSSMNFDIGSKKDAGIDTGSAKRH